MERDEALAFLKRGYGIIDSGSMLINAELINGFEISYKHEFKIIDEVLFRNDGTFLGIILRIDAIKYVNSGKFYNLFTMSPNEVIEELKQIMF